MYVLVGGSGWYGDGYWFCVDWVWGVVWESSRWGLKWCEGNVFKFDISCGFVVFICKNLVD